MNSMPPPGRTSRITSGDPGSRDWRSIRPPLAKEDVAPEPVLTTADVSCADISPSPAIGSDVNWNESAVPQMSEPDPNTLIVSGHAVAEPDNEPTAPTSADRQVLHAGVDGDKNARLSPLLCTYESPTIRYGPASIVPLPLTAVLKSGVPL